MNGISFTFAVSGFRPEQIKARTKEILASYYRRDIDRDYEYEYDDDDSVDITEDTALDADEMRTEQFVFTEPRRRIIGNTLDFQRKRWQRQVFQARRKRLKSYQESTRRCLRAKRGLSDELVEAHRTKIFWARLEDLHAEIDQAFEMMGFSVPPDAPDDVDAADGVDALEERYEAEIALGLWDYAKRFGSLPTYCGDELRSFELWVTACDINAWLKTGVIAQMWLSEDELVDEFEFDDDDIDLALSSLVPEPHNPYEQEFERFERRSTRPPRMLREDDLETDL